MFVILSNFGYFELLDHRLFNWRQVEQVPFADNNLTVSNIICDHKHVLIGLSDGSLYNISWKGELEFSMPLMLLFVLFSDGQLMLCSVSKKGLKHADSVKAERRMAYGNVVCAAVASAPK
ncbi:Hypothetical predicted protein [Olea europaea subsp. europaea]|uniref:Uncharacterized protein n=1 Tax=Olea europaea subsp. europaea TaxID=158383 RepID=A0A8S0TRV3_OLEEU|nr:Hypothetical predicted protein [Olea europaea subsp. europaea]